MNFTIPELLKLNHDPAVHYDHQRKALTVVLQAKWIGEVLVSQYGGRIVERINRREWTLRGTKAVSLVKELRWRDFV